MKTKINDKFDPPPSTAKRRRLRTCCTGKSLLDKKYGQHINSLIVAILFIVTVLCFIIYTICLKGDLSESVVTGFIGLLSGFAAFFVASIKHRKS
jgi:hypothetical protein